MPMELQKLRSRLLWLMFIRVVTVTLLLGGLALIQLKAESSLFSTSLLSLYFLVGFAYFLTVVYAVLINQLKRLEGVAFLQMFGDVFFVTLLVYATGGLDSLFSWAYIFVIIAASILLYQKGAVIVASASIISYALLLLSSYLGWVRPLGANLYGARELSSSLLVNLSAFLMVAALSSYLVGQLRRTGELLREKEIDYEELNALNRDIVDSLAHGLITTDRTGMITNLNKAGQRMVGKRLTDLHGIPVRELFPEISDYLHPEESGIGFLKKEYSLKFKDRYLHFHVSELKNASEQRIGWLLNFEDLTKLRELEERARIEDKLRAQQESLEGAEEPGFENLIGKSDCMKEIYQFIRQVAPTNSNILITGESGTGKEEVARAIHYHSLRRDDSFVAVNLGAIPETLMESELFGHKKGSFTGAISDKPGLFEVARGGTLFLDEIGELSPATQVKLLRVIQEKSFRQLGDTRDHTLDVRLICATNKELWAEVKKGNFREDLYYRLNVIQVDLPPLRDRGDDILLLAQFFLEKYSQALKKEVKEISPRAMQLLMEYPFPGNVRELENIIERGVAFEAGPVLLPENLPAVVAGMVERDELEQEIDFPAEGLDLEKRLEEIEKGYLLKAIERAQGVKTKAAELLGLKYRSFRHRLAKYGIGEGDEAHF